VSGVIICREISVVSSVSRCIQGVGTEGRRNGIRIRASNEACLWKRASDCGLVVHRRSCYDNSVSERRIRACCDSSVIALAASFLRTTLPRFRLCWNWSCVGFLQIFRPVLPFSGRFPLTTGTGHFLDDGFLWRENPSRGCTGPGGARSISCSDFSGCAG